MSTRRIILLVPLAILAIAQQPARAVEREDLQQRQQMQQRARELARELVAGILDIQMRQLQENGLSELPIYDEIRKMRVNLDQLVDGDMQEVVQLLAAAQEGSQKQRLDRFEAARGKIREIIVHLTAERQKLLRRLQIERLAAQVRQLIQLQTRTQQATETLPERPDDQRESYLLSTVADQRDVHALFLALVEALADVSTWAGPAGANAADGLRILKAGQVAQAADQANRHLESSLFSEASSDQRSVLKGLRAVLRQLEEAQGLISSDRETAINLVRDLLKQQEQLREDTQQLDPFNGPQAEALIERQSELHQSLGELAEALQPFTATEPLMEQAKASAYEAMAQMFETHKPQTLSEQNRVIGSLAEIEARLQHEIQWNRDDQSADALAEEVRRLEQLEAGLESIAEQQSQVVAKAAEAIPDAARIEMSVADALDDAVAKATSGEQPLPGVVESRLSEAQLAVADARDQLQAEPAVDNGAQRQAAVQAARALERALAETQAQLADTRRRQLAVEVGELARAAEALERAAASEREIGRIASEAAASEGLTEGELAEFATEQTHVAEVAERIAAGVQPSEPRAADLLKRAEVPIAAAARQIDEALQLADQPSRAESERIAGTAEQAARELSGAAAELRRHVEETAKDLVEVADQQLDQLAQVQGPLDDTVNRIDPEGPRAIGRFADALDAVREAEIEQLRAQGRSDAADAAKETRAVGRLLASQAAADRAAADVASGRANTPLEAVTRQQRVAEDAAAMAAENEGQLADALRAASQAAAETARETLGGDRRRAELARQATRQALNAAGRTAQDGADQASRQPPGTPDAEAQQRVGRQTAEASELAGNADADSAQALAEAQRGSVAATASLQAGEPQAAAKAQADTARALRESAEHLQAALDAQLTSQAARMQEQAARASELAALAGPVSPEAAAALDAAGQAAGRPSDSQSRAATAETPSAGQHQTMATAAEETRQAFQRAAASLAARQQTIQRDRDVARAMATLAQEQGDARAEIARQAEQLTTDHPVGRSSAGDTGTDDPDSPSPSAGQVAAAEALQRATERFAETQRAVGEGAVEISGQQQVANQPLLEGLQAASELALATSPQEPEPELAIPGVTALPDDALTGGQSANADATPAGTPEPGTQGAANSAAASDPNGGDSAPARTAADTGRMGSPAADAAYPPNPSGLGTGFVPDSPEATAAQIAGTQAMAQAAQTLAAAPALAAADAQSSGSTASDSQQSSTNSSDSQQGQASPSSSLAASGGVSTGGPETENSETAQSELEMQPEAQGDSRTAAGGQEARWRQKEFADEPWFARLPPSLRQAIQAQARQRPPRGYEERLRRYFGSAD